MSCKYHSYYCFCVLAKEISLSFLCMYQPVDQSGTAYLWNADMGMSLSVWNVKPTLTTTTIIYH